MWFSPTHFLSQFSNSRSHAIRPPPVRDAISPRLEVIFPLLFLSLLYIVYELSFRHVCNPGGWASSTKVCGQIRQFGRLLVLQRGWSGGGMIGSRRLGLLKQVYFPLGIPAWRGGGAWGGVTVHLTDSGELALFYVPSVMRERLWVVWFDTSP